MPESSRDRHHPGHGRGIRESVGTPETSAPSTSPLIRWVLPAGIVALAVALIGGYAFGWSWTGITPRDQMWDLLHVIVLPAVLATLPSWYRTRNRWKMEWHAVFGVLGVVFAVLVFGGYALNWRWTGFQGNTLWDWLELLALPLVVIVAGGYALGWGWTGFRGNTLWDWIRLLLVPFVLPATLAWFSARSESERLRSQASDSPAAPEPTLMGYEREQRAPNA